VHRLKSGARAPPTVTVTPARVKGRGMVVAGMTPVTMSPVQKIVPIDPLAGSPVWKLAPDVTTIF